MVDNNCIIEGNVKFRDGKKWKSRWCVMRKLSPVADCLHLQLYGDSKERYKQGQTKASLSLQHFLAVQSGFTLDKESNTIAIVCQDVTVVLAFDTRERLIQWQVKISNNLGEDQQFLVLISSAPPRAKLASGPAQLHVQRQRFCMTVGVPPRLVGTWQIGQLRRYGVVDGRFCFEGGSRCGRGEGLHVLLTDQGDEIVRALQRAADVRRGRQQHQQDSPRRQLGRADSRAADSLASFDEACGDTSYWSSAESRRRDDCEADYGASLASDLAMGCRPSAQPSSSLERCASCIGKLGSISKSSTCATSVCSPAPLPPSAQIGPFDRLSLSSYASSGPEAEGAQAECRCSPQPASPSPLALPPRPPRPKPKKPPMPLPPEQACTCARPSRNGAAGPYENYDVPKTIPVPAAAASSSPSAASAASAAATAFDQASPQADQYYDTPRKLKECLASSSSPSTALPPKAYPNYDMPQAPQAVARQQCGCPSKLTPQAKSLAGCPCHNVISWAGFVLPYCRRGAGIEPTERPPVQPVRLSGEGKMPVVNASGQLAIYHGGSPSAASHDCPVHASPPRAAETEHGANYENIEPAVIDTQPEAQQQPANYANIEFTESLANYENSRQLLAKVQAREQAEECDKDQTPETPAKQAHCHGDKVCRKCGQPKGHGCQDYLVADEQASAPKKSLPADYMPMQPVHNACSKDVLSRLCSGVKSSSNPALSAPLELNKKRSESEYRVPGSAMLSSPYFRRRLLEMSNCEAGASLGMLLRKRSYSTESAHCLDDEKGANTFTTSAAVHECPSDSDKAPAGGDLGDSESDSPDAVSLSPQPLAAIKIRRSSSVPSKAGHNRDSSSSNDSGVSTGSLSHRTAEFVEYEYSASAANALVKKQSAPLVYQKSSPPACFHDSLPRKSKSSDPLKEISFQFHKAKLPAKSSSAEADIPTCLPQKGSKEFSSPSDAPSVPYIDSRSTSSGTSDMSDYIETLSLSSHSSSDAPDNLRIGGRAVATTLRPRSGKEYYKIDRSILVEQGRTISTSSNYANITPFTRKDNQRHPVT